MVVAGSEVKSEEEDWGRRSTGDQPLRSQLLTSYYKPVLCTRLPIIHYLLSLTFFTFFTKLRFGNPVASRS
jgi:hypothetical protein